MNDKKHSDKYSVKEFVKKFGFDNCVLELLNFIEKDNKTIKDIIINKYLEKPISENEEESLINYFLHNSILSAATIANPATSVVTELLYEKPNFILPIDNYFLNSKSGDAIFSRLHSVENNLYLLIKDYFQRNNKILIGNIGGGPSKDIINIFSKHYKDNDNIRAISIDRDEFIIKKGIRISKINDTGEKIEFFKTNFMKYNPKKKFDIVLLIGILCSLPSETCILVLKKIKKMISKNGYIVVSNADPKMLENDPFTYFIMENILNWKLIFKNKENLENILIKAGYEWQGSFTDKYGFHNMGIGTIKSFF